jgi:hypothetical protein
MAFHKYYTKVEYSKRPDGRWNKWQQWSAANLYDWDFSSHEDDILALWVSIYYPKWVLVDVVDRKG